MSGLLWWYPPLPVAQVQQKVGLQSQPAATVGAPRGWVVAAEARLKGRQPQLPHARCRMLHCLQPQGY